MEQNKTIQGYTTLPKARDEDKPEIKVYSRRWYTLALFCCVSFNTALLWNTWGPISDSAQLVFGFGSTEIASTANIGQVAYTITVFAGTYLVDDIGLRAATLAGSGLMLLAAGIRCFSTSSTVMLWTSYVSAGLNGVAGTVPFAGPAAFSSNWFPPNQRATATAIAVLFNNLGFSLSFLIGPAFVHYEALPNNTHTNMTTMMPIHNITTTEVTKSTTSSENTTTVLPTESPDSIVTRQRNEIMHFLYTETAWCALIFILLLIYFPSRPPQPPSTAASTPRVPFKVGIKKIVLTPAMWMIALAYGLPSGPFNAWFTTLNNILEPLHVKQKDSAYLGFYSTIVGAVSGVIVSRFSDIFSRRMKTILLVFYVAAAGSIVWSLLLCLRYTPFSLGQLYGAGILAGVCINGAAPLFFEMGAEVCFPIAEGLVGGVLTLANNITGIIFLSLVAVTSLGTEWVMWALVGSVVAALPLLFFMKEKYSRLDIDVDKSKYEDKPDVSVNQT